MSSVVSDRSGLSKGIEARALDDTFATLLLSPDGVILRANKASLRMLMLDEQPAGLCFRDILADAGLNPVATSYHSLLGGARMRLRRCDGETFWADVMSRPVDAPAKGGHVVIMCELSHEILRQAEQESQLAAVRNSHAVITFDMDGLVLEANTRFLAAMGYDLSEIAGRHHRMFVDAAHAHSAEYAQLWSDLRRGNHRAGQFRRIGKNGVEVWMQATYNPVFDIDGKPVKVIKYATVVTDMRLLQAEQQGQIAAIHNALCVISYDPDGTIIDVNENFLDATGYTYAEVLRHNHSQFMPDGEAKGENYRLFWEALSEGRSRSGEYERRRRDGGSVWLQGSYNPIFDMNGKLFKVVEFAIDVTSERARQADDRGQIEAMNRSQSVMTLGLDGTIIDANENMLDVLGYELDEIVGRKHSMLVDPEVVLSSDYADFWHRLRSGSYHSGLYRRIGKSGRPVWLQASYTPVLGLNGKPGKVIKIASDVSSNIALAEAFEDARRMAQHDAATALPNRVRLMSFLSGELASKGANLALLYLDLDGFVALNADHGREVGDKILGEIADRLRRLLREDQLAARAGGDEFIIAAPRLDDAEIDELCRRIIETVSAPIDVEGISVSVSMSIGVAIAPTDGVTPDALLRAADAALTRARSEGGGMWAFFSGEARTRVETYRQMTQSMRLGLERGDFFVEYQPRFDTATKTIRSVEALARWRHPDVGAISPADFIPVSERNGLIVPLGELVLRQACRAALDWPDIRVSVNVSPVQFREISVRDLVAAVLADIGLEPGRLQLEVTESLLIENAERAKAELTALKELGVTLAIDDFGTGYSSLGYLRDFPFDALKIDRQFVADVDSSERGRAIFHAIVSLGHSLGLSVTAEG